MGISKHTQDLVDRQLAIQRGYQHLVQNMFPYVSLSNPFSLSYDWLHTDKFGYRLDPSSYQAWSKSVPRGSQTHVFTGGSVCFGSGASGDEFTAPARFGSIAKVPTRNLGIGGGNSTSEFISAALFGGESDSAVSITGTNTLVNVFLNWPKTSEVELFMPFHQELWEKLSSRDLLSNRYLLDPMLDPAPYFKNETQRATFRKVIRDSFFKRMFARFRRESGVNSIPNTESYEEIVEIALMFQVENMVRISKMFYQHLVVVQPYLLSDKRKMTAEEALIVDKHIVISRDPALQALFYDFLPSVYADYCIKLKRALTEKSVKTIIYTPPSDVWSYSDLCHLNDAGYADLARRIYDCIN